MRVAVFGAGVIGKLRSASVVDNGRTELVAVADVDEGRARAAATGSGAAIFTDYRAAIAAGPLDAVIVSSPVHLHEEMCLAAFQAGCHVLCEKPLSNSLESCRRIAAAAAAAGKTLAVGFNLRYYPAVKYLTDVIQRGVIGKIDHVRVFGGHDGLAGFRADWMYKSALSGGGAMMDVGIHTTDLVNHVAGDVVEVSGIATGSIWNVEGSEDNAIAVMRTARDIPVIYQATWTEWKGYKTSIEVYGELGMVSAQYAPMSNLLITHDKPGGKRKRTTKLYPEIILREKLKGWETTTRITFDEELEDFLKMIAGEQVRLAAASARSRWRRQSTSRRASTVRSRCRSREERGDSDGGRRDHDLRPAPVGRPHRG
ncbi:MAG: Gfo/Idh/MocA family oxidoreductase [Gemmatimonadota bacterium]